MQHCWKPVEFPPLKSMLSGISFPVAGWNMASIPSPCPKYLDILPCEPHWICMCIFRRKRSGSIWIRWWSRQYNRMNSFRKGSYAREFSCERPLVWLSFFAVWEKVTGYWKISISKIRGLYSWSIVQIVLISGVFAEQIRITEIMRLGGHLFILFPVGWWVIQICFYMFLT